MKKLLCIIPILILLSACKSFETIVEVPVEVIKKEYIHDTMIDSIYIRDSIDRWRNGDTVFIYKEHTKFRYINKIDTVVKVDSIPKIMKVQTTKTVEVNHLKWYQKVLMWVGGLASLLSISYIVYKIKLK